MATKYRAVCNDCDFRGNWFEKSLTAKNQRNQHQIATDFTHHVDIEIKQEVFTLISHKDIDDPKSKANMKKLFG